MIFVCRMDAASGLTLSHPKSERGRFAQMPGSRDATINKEARTQVELQIKMIRLSTRASPSIAQNAWKI